FLGFGVTPPDTSLGQIVSEYQNAFSTRPWLFWWPGLFIILIALSVNFIGDGLRDAFDPKQTRVRAGPQRPAPKSATPPSTSQPKTVSSTRCEGCRSSSAPERCSASWGSRALASR